MKVEKCHCDVYEKLSKVRFSSQTKDNHRGGVTVYFEEEKFHLFITKFSTQQRKKYKELWEKFQRINK
jgi:hypothetical protein